MGGKAILLVVMGFSLTFLILGQNFGRMSNLAVKNEVKYYNQSIAHTLAMSGANMEANKVYRNQNWTQPLSISNFQNGEISVTVQILDAFRNIRRINSVGIYQGDTATVQVTLQPSKFSKFAYYSEDENGIWWTDGDIVDGPFHTQDYIHVSGHPVFNGKVTTLKGIRKYHWWGNSDSPIINGTYQQGVNMPMPNNNVADLKTSAQQNGYKFTSEDTVYLNFDKDSLKYKFAYNSPDSTVLLSDFAPNGVLFANNAVLRIKGTVKGRYSVGASGNSSGGKGNIYIDDNIVYNSDPRTDPYSNDLLGIVAEKNVLVADNTPNRHDVYIDAAIYSQTGGFGAENYKTRPNSGTIYLYGGVSQHSRQAVGTFNGGGIVSGFNKNYTYDERLMKASPPDYPNTGSLEIVSWFEKNGGL
jgi:hypothetical protein